jgi:hypothetical protein
MCPLGIVCGAPIKTEHDIGMMEKLKDEPVQSLHRQEAGRAEAGVGLRENGITINKIAKVSCVATCTGFCLKNVPSNIPIVIT